MAVNVWQISGGSLSGNWSSSGRWSLGHTPLGTDDLVINVASATP